MDPTLKQETIRLLRASQGWPVPDYFWDLVTHQEYDEPYDPRSAAEIADHEDVKALCRIVRNCIEEAGNAPAPRTSPTSPTDARTISTNARTEAISRVLAAKAAAMPEVIEFRANHLPEDLLQPQQQAVWLRRRGLKWGYRQESEPTISWNQPDHRSPRQRQGAFSGLVLSELCELSGQLSDWYGWSPYASTTFVLCGLCPQIPAWNTTFHLRGPYSAVSRLTLELDPTLTVDQVADIYRKTRAQHLPGVRTRELGQESLDHAVFYAETPGLSWSQRHFEWKKQYPAKSHEASTKNFSRDCRRALTNLLSPRIITGRT